MNNSPNTTRPLLLCGLLALLLSLLGTPGRAQSCSFSDPQKQLEYQAIKDIINSNYYLTLGPSTPAWAQFANGQTCNVCALTPQVACNASGYIVKVDFSYTNAYGSLDTLPESFGNLIHLTSLDLSQNIGLKALPESFGNLDSLEVFSAWKCSIKALPESFGSLSSLKAFGLEHNKLTSLPASFAQLPNLQYAYLNNNLLTSLPDDIGSLQTHDSALPPYTATFTYLSLIDNLLTTLPASLGNAVDLHIDASNNKISCLPAELNAWCDPSKNNYLDINHNPIGITLGQYCTTPIPLAYTCGPGQIDLSLSLQQLTASPAQWGSYPVKLTISNAGSQAATGVVVKFAKPTGVVYVGGNAYTASQGSFSPDGDEAWAVGSVPAGGSATLTVNYFLLNPTAPVAYAQVTAANETDTDSQPNNGTPFMPSQDDEASTAGSNGEPLQPDLTVSDLQIPTPSVTVGSNLIYNFDAANIGTAAVPANFYIKAYFSTDQTLGADDILVTTLAGFPLTYGVGASHQDITIINAHAPQSLGQYYLIVKIDADGTVAESNEGNNTVVKPFTVTVFCSPDLTPPTITNCPAGFFDSTTGTSAPTFWTQPTATDNCTATPTLTSNYSPGASFSIGTTTVTYTATDGAGNTATCSFPVTVTQQAGGPCAPDTAPPAIANCPSNIAKTTTGTTATATWAAPTATDNCTATPTLTSSHSPGASFPLGTTTVTYTAKDGANNTATCSFNVTVTQQAGGGQIDLGLALQQLTATPTQWGNYQVKATVSNAGPQAATGVKVRFAKPAGVVYVGGNAYTASQGSFSPDGDEIWNVGSVPAGGSATLTVNYFLLSPTAPVAYAQVTAADQADGDSQPNNGTPPTPAQDDEASTAGGGGTSPCSPDTAPPAIANCPANIAKTTTGTSATATWAAPTATDNCTATPTLTSSHAPGASFPLGTTTVTYTAKDGANNTATCSFTVTVTQQAGGGQIDLSLALQQLTATPTQWGNYQVKATVSNAGPQAATGVKVRFAKPNGVVYVGGNAYTASQGSFSPEGDEIWSVGSVPAGGSATLTVNYFLLSPTAPVAYAQVTAANETDTDSQPNNGTPPTPAQDDEASTANGGNSGGGGTNQQPDLAITDLQVPNGSVAAGAVLSYNFDASNAGTAAFTGGFSIKSYISTDQILSANDVQDGTIQTGNYAAGFSAQNVAGASTIPANLAAGQYYLIVKIDADNIVGESNENNNTVVKPFTVTGGGGGGDCHVLIGAGTVTCVENTANSNLSITYHTNDSYSTAVLDGTGQIVSTQPANPPTASPTYRVMNGYLEKLLGTTVVYSLAIPTAISSEYDQIKGFIEMNGGYVLLGIKASAPYELVGIRTDNNLKVQQTAIVGTFIGIGTPTVSSIISVANDIFAFTTGSNNYSHIDRLFVVNNNLEVLSSEIVQNVDIGSMTLGKNGCGKFTMTSGYLLEYYNYNKNGQLIQEGHFESGHFIREHIFESSHTLDMGYASDSYSWELNLPDGTTIQGNSIYDNALALVKKQGSTVIWEKYFEVPNIADIRRIALSGGNVVFISESNGSLYVQALSCLEIANPKPDLVVRPGSASAIVNGIATDGSIAAGSNFYINCTVYNAGFATVPGFTVRYFLSSDNSYSPGSDIVLGENSFPAIMPDEYNNNTLPNQFVMPANVAVGSYYVLMLADPGNMIAELDENNNLYFTPVTVAGVGGNIPDCAAITITPAPGKITISGISAPHVLIKVFRPDWTLAYECLDGQCASPAVVGGLTAGTYHVHVKLIDGTWNELCHIDRDVSVAAGIGGGNGTAISVDDDRQRLSIDNVYPNPASYSTTLDIHSFKEQDTVLDFYDDQGRAVHSMDIHLEEGRNLVEVVVWEWRSGAYSIILRGNGLPAYGRFLKIWE